MERRSYRSWKSTASALIGKIKVDVGDVATTRTSSERAPSLCFYWTHWNSERFRDSFRTVTSIWTSSATAASSTTLMRLTICFVWVFFFVCVLLIHFSRTFKLQICHLRLVPEEAVGEAEVRKKEGEKHGPRGGKRKVSFLAHPPSFFFLFFFLKSMKIQWNISG